MAFITVVVPVYKVPFDYLDKCIDSIVNQTLKDIEIILVDDGSPVEWADKCDSYRVLDNRIKSVHKPNGGLSDARNYGLRNCTSKWITFLDGDDWFEADFLENFYKKVLNDEKPADIYMYSGFRNYPDREIEGIPHFPKGTTFETYEERENLQTRCFTNHIAKGGNIKGITISSGCMKVYNVDFLRSNDLLFPIVPYDEDSLFYLISIEKAKKIEYVGDSIYHYRFTEGSIVNRYRPNAVHEQELYLGYIFNFIKEYNKSEDFINKAYMRVMTSMLLLIKLKFFNSENKDNFLKRQRECAGLFNTEPYRSALKKLDTSKMRRNAIIKLYMLRLHLYGLLEYARQVGLKNTIK